MAGVSGYASKLMSFKPAGNSKACVVMKIIDFQTSIFFLRVCWVPPTQWLIIFHNGCQAYRSYPTYMDH